MKIHHCAAWSDSPAAAASYSGAVSQFQTEPHLAEWARTYARDHAGRLQWDVNFLLQHYQFANCINIGGAPFVFEYLMKKARPELPIVSVDLNPRRFPQADRVLRVTTAQLDIEHPDPAALAALGKFDCVVFCEIFEHLRVNILETVALLRELLVEGGILYLTTPNGLGCYAIWENLHGHSGSDPVGEWSKLTRLGHMGHVREYSSAEVANVLRHCGFVVEQQFYRRCDRRRSLRSKVASLVKWGVTGVLPWLGDELVFVARNGDRPVTKGRVAA